MGEFVLDPRWARALMGMERAGRRTGCLRRTDGRASGRWGRRLGRLAPAGLALLVLGGCQGQQHTLSGSTALGLPRVVAADGVLCDLVQRLAAEDLTVTCLLGPGEDPHAFRPTPSQRQALAAASLVLINGYQLTPALERVPGVVPLAERAVPDSPRLEAPHHHAAESTASAELPSHPPASAPIEPLHQPSDAHAGDRDPHVWHDPLQARALVAAAAQRLTALQPRRSAAIAVRAERLKRLLEALDRWNRQQLATIPPGPTGQRPTLATGHRAAASLARRYALEELPLVDAHSSSAVLRPEALQEVVAELRRRQVRSLFAEPGPPPRALLRISQLAGVPISPAPLVLDGLARADGGPPSLMATLVANTCAITEGLGGRCDRQAGGALIRRWRDVGAAGGPLERPAAP